MKNEQIVVLKEVIQNQDKIYKECCQFVGFMSQIFQKDYFTDQVAR